MKERIMEDKKVILRHSPIELIEHWVLAISGLLLIFSGFGELPMYKRYMVTQIPGLGWAGDFFINLKIHYLAGIIFVSVMIFHGIFHGWLGHRGLLPRKGDVKASLITILSMFGFGREPESDKYLPEQRLAYAYLGGLGLILVLTGAVKVLKNLPGIYLPPVLVTTMTLTHTFATIFFLLGVMAHLTALIFKVNRPLAKSIFTREVDLDYARERHTIWYDELMRRKAKVKEETRVEEKVEAEVGVKDQGLNGAEALKEEIMTTLKVKGMSCQHCVMSVTKALNKLEGVENVQVDLAKGEVRFENSKGIISSQINKAIEDAGYEVVTS
jgi:copper ion binding protein